MGRNSTKSAISRKSLSEQCNILNLALNQIPLDLVGGKWFFGGRSFPGPEAAALASFQHRGFDGAACEGGPILLALKAAGFRWIVEHNTFNDRKDAINRYLEAAIEISKNNRTGFVDAVRRSSIAEFNKHFQEIYSSGFIQSNYPGITVGFMMALKKALGNKLADISAQFVEAPYDYRAGWPDLTLVRSRGLFSRGEFQFVEVKTTDRIHSSQERIINDFMKPLNLPFSVCQLVPQPK